MVGLTKDERDVLDKYLTDHHQLTPEQRAQMDHVRDSVREMREASAVHGRRPDDIVASEIKRDMRQAVEHICGVINSAKAKGFVVTYGTCSDAAGDEDINHITVAKHF